MERCCEEELWRSVVVRWCRDMMCGKCCERVLWRSVVRECCGEFVWPCFVGSDVTRIVLEGCVVEVCGTRYSGEVLEKKALGKSVGGEWYREVLRKSAAGMFWKGVFKEIFFVISAEKGGQMFRPFW